MKKITTLILLVGLFTGCNDNKSASDNTNDSASMATAGKVPPGSATDSSSDGETKGISSRGEAALPWTFDLSGTEYSYGGMKGSDFRYTVGGLPVTSERKLPFFFMRIEPGSTPKQGVDFVMEDIRTSNGTSMKIADAKTKMVNGRHGYECTGYFTKNGVTLVYYFSGVADQMRTDTAARLYYNESIYVFSGWLGRKENMDGSIDIFKKVANTFTLK